MIDVSLTPPSPIEQAFVVLVLVMSTGGFSNLGDVAAHAQEAGAGIVVFQFIWATIYIITGIYIWRHCREVFTFLWRARLLMLLTFLPLASALWSEYPAVTIRRAVALLATTVFGAYFALRYSLREQLRLLACMCTIIILVSYVFSLLGLGTPVNPDAPGWMGIFDHRGVLARFAVFSTLVYLVCWKTFRRPAVLFGVAACLGLIALATARAEMLYGSLLLLLFWILPLLRQSWSRVITVGGALVALSIAAVVWVIQNFEAFTAMVGRDPTMTGRLQLWGVSIYMALQRPWYGYGYSAFWVGAEGHSAAIWKVINWEAPHAHNGLLNLWIDLGLLGVVLFVVCFVAVLARALQTYRNTHADETAWLVMFLAFLVACNITESTILTGNDLFWICFVAVYVIAAKGVVRARAAGLAAPTAPVRRKYTIRLPQPV